MQRYLKSQHKVVSSIIHSLGFFWDTFCMSSMCLLDWYALASGKNFTKLLDYDTYSTGQLALPPSIALASVSPRYVKASINRLTFAQNFKVVNQYHHISNILAQIPWASPEALPLVRGDQVQSASFTAQMLADERIERVRNLILELSSAPIKLTRDMGAVCLWLQGVSPIEAACSCLLICFLSTSIGVWGRLTC